MHILGILGAIVTILVLLKRLADAGIDIGWLNPFLWHRRRSWRKRHDADPIHALDDPLEVTALLMLAIARTSGEISAEQKRLLLDSYATNFHLDEAQAAKLMAASSFLLRDGSELESKLETLVGKSVQRFSPEQAVSACDLCRVIAHGESTPSPAQARLLARIERVLAARAPAPGRATWA